MSLSTFHRYTIEQVVDLGTTGKIVKFPTYIFRIFQVPDPFRVFLVYVAPNGTKTQGGNGLAIERWCSAGWTEVFRVARDDLDLAGEDQMDTEQKALIQAAEIAEEMFR